MNKNNECFLAIPSSVAPCPRDPPELNALRTIHIEDFKKLTKQLADRGFHVQCALDLCRWDRRQFKTAPESVHLAWSMIEVCNQVIACPSFNCIASGGVHIEIGWATALCRPVTIITESIVYNASALLRGMAELRQFQCQIFCYQERPREVFDGVLERVSGLANSRTQ